MKERISIFASELIGLVVQLNRIPHYGCGGCRVESCQGHERSLTSMMLDFFVL